MFAIWRAKTVDYQSKLLEQQVKSSYVHLQVAILCEQQDNKGINALYLQCQYDKGWQMGSICSPRFKRMPRVASNAWQSCQRNTFILGIISRVQF